MSANSSSTCPLGVNRLFRGLSGSLSQTSNCYFSSPYGFLKIHKLIMEDVSNHQFRFKDVVDPKSGKKVFALEHEVRSLRHPLYHRLLVNRDPTQIQSSYVRGSDALIPVVKNQRP